MNAVKSSPIFDIGSMDDPLSPAFLDNNYHQVEQFCTPDSLKASSNYLNILLTSYGYPVPLVFDSTEVDEKCKIVNCLYSLLEDRKIDAKERQDLLEVINNMKKTQIELENQVINLKRENQLKEKTSVEIRAKLEANQNTHKKQLLQNTRLKEEISKVKNNMQYMKTQYAHESNRHEQELAKVENRLVKCMNLQYKTKIASLDINTHYGATTDNAADDDQIVQIRKKYTELLLKSNNSERNIKMENEELRNCLVSLYTGVRRLLEEQINRFDHSNNATATNQQPPRDSYFETARFRLPENCGGKEAIRMVADLLVRLKEEWNHQIDQQPHQYTEQDIIQKDEIINQLHSTIQDLVSATNQMKEEFEETTKIYKKYEQGGFFDTLYPTANEAYQSDSEEDSVVDLESDDQLKYQILKKNTMREQRKITKSAIELGYERTKLEAERWAFQEMKRELQMQEILEETPSQPQLPPKMSQQPISSNSSTNSNNNDQQPNFRARKRLKSWLGSAPSNK